MYSDVVLGLGHHHFEEILDDHKDRNGYTLDTDLTTDDWGLITRKEAVTRIDPGALDQLLHPTIDPNAERKIIATGLPASPGAASGEIVFSSDEAPEDIHGMHAAEGILTTRGGMWWRAAWASPAFPAPARCA